MTSFLFLQNHNYMQTLKKILSIIGDKTPLSEPINADCAICGHALKQGGVKFTDLFTKATFNLNHEIAKADSKHVCNHCAVFFNRNNWQAYCERNKKDPYFPRVEGKKPFLANWMFYSHYFAKNDHRIVKKRQDWRRYLLTPPKPPFCFVLTTLAKKHLIFKSDISYDQQNYPIRFEDKIVYINVNNFKTCLTAFERLYNAGLSKASIKTGDYNTSMLLKVNKKLLFENEAIIKNYRDTNPDYLAICEYIGAKQD